MVEAMHYPASARAPLETHSTRGTVHCSRRPVQIADTAVGVVLGRELLLVLERVVLRCPANPRVAHSRVEEGGNTHHVQATEHHGQRRSLLLSRRGEYEIATKNEQKHEQQECHPIPQCPTPNGTDPVREKG